MEMNVYDIPAEILEWVPRRQRHLSASISPKMESARNFIKI